MNWSELAPTIAKAAPLLGSLLGPIGTIAGGAVGAIISSVTGTPSDDPAAAAAAIGADPALLEKLREAELANQTLLASYALQQRQAELVAQTAADAQRTAQIQSDAADRDSARQLAAKQPGDWMRPALGCAIVIATIGVVFLVLLGFADGTLRDPVIAATAGGLVMYFLKESDKVTSFLFGTTSEAASQTRQVTQFAVSPGTVTTSSGQATAMQSAAQ
ncbi:hypothetical protein HDG34_005891 [Paraburkholderia sp. HC6.4b]|uniref:hypothetical protein n=1 Tax=unclassified Paraburkholderia TaxID=2615204 RepID=UPI0016150047|nr:MULTISPECIES: hypothetical protein [unclassified Paraburkholderia]MBB5411925.1 hypothetical protein [Paraburkholderia sp. HC6.4b]MBB5450237.1 hypothetical protein [Paraburkholderia sp. Kb1A]